MHICKYCASVSNLSLVTWPSDAPWLFGQRTITLCDDCERRVKAVQEDLVFISVRIVPAPILLLAPRGVVSGFPEGPTYPRGTIPGCVCDLGAHPHHTPCGYRVATLVDLASHLYKIAGASALVTYLGEITDLLQGEQKDILWTAVYQRFTADTLTQRGFPRIRLH